MTREKRIEFFWVTLAAFLAAFLLYFSAALSAALIGNTNIPGPPALIALLLGILGGWLVAGLVGGAVLFARFVARRSLGFKIVCAALFMVTFMVVAYVGIFATIPYGIYNIVKILNRSDPPAAPGPIPPFAAPANPYAYAPIQAPYYGPPPGQQPPQQGPRAQTPAAPAGADFGPIGQELNRRAKRAKIKQRDGLWPSLCFCFSAYLWP